MLIVFFKGLTCIRSSIPDFIQSKSAQSFLEKLKKWENRIVFHRQIRKKIGLSNLAFVFLVLDQEKLKPNLYIKELLLKVISLICLADYINSGLRVNISLKKSSTSCSSFCIEYVAIYFLNCFCGNIIESVWYLNWKDCDTTLKHLQGKT